MEIRDAVVLATLAVAISSFGLGFFIGHIAGFAKGMQEMRRALRGSRYTD